MIYRLRDWRWPWLAAAIVVVMLSGLALAGPRSIVSDTASGDAVEMFSAIEKGQIDVKVIPKDSTQVRVLVTNKTEKPLSVKLPAAFAAVPVLAAVAPGPAGGGGRAAGANAQPQAMGGGMGGMGGGMGGMGGMGGGGGFMNVAPEKVGQLKATTVCLEHGKAEPRAATPYEIKPIDQVTSKPEVQEVCRMAGQGAVSQRIAQIAAWHLNNNMSWQQLANKQYKFANGGGTPYFSPQEIQAAMQLVAATEKVVQQRKKAIDPVGQLRAAASN